MPTVEAMLERSGKDLPRWKQGACSLVLGVSSTSNEIKVLMTQRRDGSGWTLPGGKIEPGERAEQAGIRETFEETGIVLTPEKLRHLYSGVEITGWVTNCFYFTDKFFRIKAHLIQQREGEAPFKWGTWEELFEGPFGSFCQKVFEQARL